MAFLPFHFVGPGDQTQIVRLGGNCLWPDMAVTESWVFLKSSESEPLDCKELSHSRAGDVVLLQETRALSGTIPSAGQEKRWLSLSDLIHTWEGLTSLHAMNSFPSKIAVF